MTDDTRWDHALKVTSDGEGLTGQAGAVLLRKLADQVGLTAALGSAGAGREVPAVDRGIALVSMAAVIVLGATSMNDIALLAHQEPLLGGAPSDTTVRRTLELADPRTLDKIARARARIRDPRVEAGRARRRAGSRGCGLPGGKDHYAADRAEAELVAGDLPAVAGSGPGEPGVRDPGRHLGRPSGDRPVHRPRRRALRLPSRPPDRPGGPPLGPGRLRRYRSRRALHARALLASSTA